MTAGGTGKNGNLRPVTSSEEARTRGHNGGKKSGIVRRGKRAIAEKIEVMLNREVANPQIKTLMKGDFSKNAKTYEDAIIAAQIYQAVKGNTKAFNALINNLPDDDPAGSVEQCDYSVNDLMIALENRVIKGIDDVKGDAN